MDVWLIIVACIGVALTFGVAVYLVALYCSVEDHNQAWFPKAVVVLGLSLAGFTVLLLPYDVANRKDPEVLDATGGGIDTALIWQIVLIAIVAMVIFVTPFTTFYYEAWDPDLEDQGGVIRHQIRSATCYTFVIAFIFFMLFVILWYTAGHAVLPFHTYTAPPQNWNLNHTVPTQAPGTYCYCDSTGKACAASAAPGESFCDSGSGNLDIRVSSFVYMIGLLCAFGWVFFVVFGGVGIIALPLDLINRWRMRPRKMTPREWRDEKDRLTQKVVAMLDRGKALELKEERGEKGLFGGTRKKVNKYKADAQMLEQEYDMLVRSDPAHDENREVLKAWLTLPVGVVGLIITILWVVHMIVHNVLDAHPFLNSLFIKLDEFFPIFGVGAYACFSLWLLWAAVKGVFKLGLNFGIIQIHPMKVNATLMSSFLFNTLIVLLVSVVVAQFCAMSFRQFAANTVVDGIFLTYVNHLQGIGYVMRYFQYAMLGFAGIALVYLGFKPCCCRGREND